MKYQTHEQRIRRLERIVERHHYRPRSPLVDSYKWAILAPALAMLGIAGYRLIETKLIQYQPVIDQAALTFQ